MSDRHCHITSFLHEDERVIGRFIAAAEATGFFREVTPLRRGERTWAVAFLSKDLDGISDELEMPEIAGKLAGVLADDIVIVSAWDGPAEEGTAFRRSFRDREHAWFVRGTGRHIPGEVVREHVAIEGER